MAAAAASCNSAPKPSGYWLPKLGLRRRRHPSPLASRSESLRLRDDHCGGGGDQRRSRRTRGLAEVFRRFDADGDGKVSSEELLLFLTAMGEGVAAADVERVLRDLDSDGDGLMDYGDFVRLMGRRGDGGASCWAEAEEADLRAAFEMFAAEKGSGYITPAGLRRALGRLGDERSPEECAAMIRAFDADGNGLLDYQEFYKMMT